MFIYMYMIRELTGPFIGFHWLHFLILAQIRCVLFMLHTPTYQYVLKKISVLI